MSYARVIADFVAEAQDEISVQCGNIVKVLEIEDDGWCNIEFEGKVGLFPPTYLSYEDIPENENEELNDSEIPTEENDIDSELESSEQRSEVLEESTEDILNTEEYTESETQPEEEEEEDSVKETPEERAIRKEAERKKHRKLVINEIRVTESDYVKDIGIIVNVFSTPLRSEGILSPAEMVALFSNIEVIVNVNQKLLGELDANDDNETILIGKIFLGMADFFKMYTAYCANQPKAMEVLDALGRNPQFKAFTDKCMLDPECRGLTLFSFLIKPIQRICKYPLLLRDLLKVTPEDHEDHDNLVAALGKIEEVVTYVNERKRLAENLQKILDVQKQIESTEELNLVSPSRRFVREGVFKVFEKSKPHERCLYLFNDLIVMTKPRKSTNGKDHFKYQLSLNDAQIIDVADTNEVQFACEIRPKGCEDKKNAYIIVFPNVKDKYLWVKEIKSLVKEFQKRQYMEKKRLAAEGGIAISDADSKPEDKKERNLKDSKKKVSEKKKPVKPEGSPGPTRAAGTRNAVSSVIGGSPFSSWRKSSSRRGEPTAEKKPKPIKSVSKTKAQQMIAPKPPKPQNKKSSKSTRSKSAKQSSRPPPKVNPLLKNSDFAAQLNATLKARGSQ